MKRKHKKQWLKWFIRAVTWKALCLHTVKKGQKKRKKSYEEA